MLWKIQMEVAGQHCANDRRPPNVLTANGFWFLVLLLSCLTLSYFVYGPSAVHALQTLRKTHKSVLSAEKFP